MTLRMTDVDPWAPSLDGLKEWDPEGAASLLTAGASPWNSGVLPAKEIELISLALYCACTNLNEAGTRRQIRAALDAGASRDEILWVLKGGAAMALHSCSLGVPILVEEMKVAGVTATKGPRPETPACDQMKAMGQWNAAWDPFYELAPLWTEEFLAFGVGLYTGDLFTPRFIELISIAFDASVTHMYAPGVRRHIKGALAAGAKPEEIMAVLQLCVSMGVQSVAVGVPILDEELTRG
jgi:alkylhydroperoxidase/carboxymuconolactone decarboxylase family protein YurZ